MTTSIALFGAGGKMGFRCAERLRDNPQFTLRCIEVSAAGAARLGTLGLQPMPADQAVRGADIVLLAVPDAVIGTIAAGIVGALKPGAMILCLDPAAAYAGDLPKREDITYFIAHPCHPPLINDEVGPARMDFFGGIAKQHIVCALMQGPEDHYAAGVEIAKIIFGPVMNAYRITVEQMAVLEPALVETTIISCLAVMREAIDEAVKTGVPEEAAIQFALGHINVAFGVLFGYSGGVFSDGALLATERGKKAIFRDNWKDVFKLENVLKEVKAITSGGKSE